MYLVRAEAQQRVVEHREAERRVCPARDQDIDANVKGPAVDEEGVGDAALHDVTVGDEALVAPRGASSSGVTSWCAAPLSMYAYVRHPCTPLPT